MARKGNGDLPPTRKWASAAFFLFGIAFLLLFVYGPPTDGRADWLRIVGVGLISVAVTLFAGINLPAIDWSTLLVSVLTRLLEAQQKKDSER